MKLILQIASVFAGARLLLASLFIGLVASTRDPEPWLFPLQLDIPSVTVTRAIWQATGWPDQYRGPTDLRFLAISLATWFVIGLVFAAAAVTLRRLGRPTA